MNQKLPTKVTIGIITYNSEPILEEYFKGLSKAGYPFELIVVDNNSREQASLSGKINNLILKYPSKLINGVTHFIPNQQNLMYTRAVNQILEASRSDVILIMNPDCYGCDEGWLAEIVKYYERHQPDIAGYKLIRQDMETIEHVGARAPGVHLGKGEKDEGQYNEPYILAEDDQYVTGACLLIPRKTVKKFGLLDVNHVHYASDREYCFTIRRGGGKVWYFPVRLIHLFGRSSY